MNKQKNKLIHALLHDLNLMEYKPDLIAQLTEGRTSSASDLTNTEQNLLIRNLSQQKEERVKKTRAKIIHLLCLYGMTTREGNPDYDRINGFVKNIGSRNPQKKLLYNLSPSEMRDVATQVERMVNKEINT